MSFKGKARKHGRRWFSMDPHGKRSKSYWRVLGDFKLSDILSNAHGDDIMEAIKTGRVRYERIDDTTDRVIVLAESGPPNCPDSGPKCVERV